MNKCISMKTRAHQRGHAKHIGMMAICCGLPIVLLIGISVYGITSQSLEYAIVLICPIGMGLMMLMMMRSNSSKSSEPSTPEAIPESIPEAIQKTEMLSEKSTNT